MAGFIKRRMVTNETLGERLRKVREGRELSYEEIETATNIRAGYLAGLEEGDYSSLPGEVYVKNFLKVYGVFLGLGEEEVMELYEREQRVDDYKTVAQYAALGRDLFGNKQRRNRPGIYKRWLQGRSEQDGKRSELGWKRIRGGKLTVRNIVLSQIFIKGLIAFLILGVFFYLGWGVRGILAAPDLTITKPPDNLVIQEARVEVAGKVESGAVLKINDSETAYDEAGDFKEVVDLGEGLNEIRITAKKAHSRESVIIRRVMVR